MDELCPLNAVKAVTEASHSDLGDPRDFLNEISEALAGLADKVEALASSATSKDCDVAKLRSKIEFLTRLVTENLKVLDSFIFLIKRLIF